MLSPFSLFVVLEILVMVAVPTFQANRRSRARVLLPLSILFSLTFILYSINELMTYRSRSQIWDLDEIPGYRSSSKAWTLTPNGFLDVHIESGKSRGRHPLHDLMAAGEKKWENMRKRQSRTLNQAVMEYRRRYRRSPPKGFDMWFKFAQERNVTLIDEFDQIDRDIAPFLALPPAVIQERVEQLEGLPVSYHIKVLDGKIELYGDLEDDQRAKGLLNLIRDFEHFLPNLIMHASGHDAGTGLLGEDMRREIERLRGVGSEISMRNLSQLENIRRNERRTVTNACSDDSETSKVESSRDQQLKHVGRFIFDPRATMNFCNNPSLLTNHGGFTFDGARSPVLKPYFVQSKLAQGSELLIPSLYNFDQIAGFGDSPWSDRIPKLYWRGRTTGTWHSKEHDWRKSHRVALHLRANAKDGDTIEEILVEDRIEQGLNLQVLQRNNLNELYMDVGLVGPPAQCSRDDGTCLEMENDLEFKQVVSRAVGESYKYALDVDGNGWSQRYRRLLASGSTILKATIYPEWNSDWLIPYYHYVPTQTDHSDLYSIMGFFVGLPGTPGNDQLAEKIASNSVRFVKENWRREDMQTYVFRLLLEYARVSSTDRKNMSYNK